MYILKTGCPTRIVQLQTLDATVEERRFSGWSVNGSDIMETDDLFVSIILIQSHCTRIYNTLLSLYMYFVSLCS